MLLLLVQFDVVSKLSADSLTGDMECRQVESVCSFTDLIWGMSLTLGFVIGIM